MKVIGGLLKNYGLLRRGEEGKIRALVQAYADRVEGEKRERFKGLSDALKPHFLGKFDAVSSVGWAWNPTTFPWTATMPDVTHVRHALALCERRAKFWTNRVNAVAGQDVKDVWFAGAHSDVGGGYQPPDHQLGRVTLGWMLRQAVDEGLLLNDPNALAGLAATLLHDEQGEQHESLEKAWWALEWVPLPHRREVNGVWEEGRRIYRGKGWRKIRPGDWVSESVNRRKRTPNNENWDDAKASVRWEP